METIRKNRLPRTIGGFLYRTESDSTDLLVDARVKLDPEHWDAKGQEMVRGKLIGFSVPHGYGIVKDDIGKEHLVHPEALVSDE